MKLTNVDSEVFEMDQLCGSIGTSKAWPMPVFARKLKDRASQ